MGRSLRRSLDTMTWYEIWVIILHTALLVLHAAVVIASMFK